MRLLLLTLVLLAISFSRPAMAQETAGAADLTPTGRGAYVSIAGAMDLFELRAGALAAEKARQPALREFGQTLLAEHEATTERLLAAARALGMEAPEPAMMPMHWEMLRRLQRASGSRFDRLFLRQQLRVHELALALHRNYAANGDRPTLREVATAAIPVIEAHLERLRAVSS